MRRGLMQEISNDMERNEKIIWNDMSSMTKKLGTQLQYPPPLGWEGRGEFQFFQFDKNIFFPKSVVYVSNNVAGVSGGSKRIKKFFMIF